MHLLSFGTLARVLPLVPLLHLWTSLLVAMFYAVKAVLYACVQTRFCPCTTRLWALEVVFTFSLCWINDEARSYVKDMFKGIWGHFFEPMTMFFESSSWFMLLIVTWLGLTMHDLLSRTKPSSFMLVFISLTTRELEEVSKVIASSRVVWDFLWTVTWVTSWASFNCQLDTAHSHLSGKPRLRNCLDQVGLICGALFWFTRAQTAVLSYCAYRRETESKPAITRPPWCFPSAVAKGPAWASPTADCDLEKCAKQTLSSLSCFLS